MYHPMTTPSHKLKCWLTLRCACVKKNLLAHVRKQEIPFILVDFWAVPLHAHAQLLAVSLSRNVQATIEEVEGVSGLLSGANFVDLFNLTIVNSGMICDLPIKEHIPRPTACESRNHILHLRNAFIFVCQSHARSTSISTALPIHWSQAEPAEECL